MFHPLLSPLMCLLQKERKKNPWCASEYALEGNMELVQIYFGRVASNALLRFLLWPSAHHPLKKRLNLPLQASNPPCIYRMV